MMKSPKISKEFVRDVAVSFCERNGRGEQQADDLAEAYSDGSLTDGYKLAKVLDDDYYWDMDAQTVATLDGFDSLVREAHKQVCIAWARDNNIQPPLPIGAMTTKGVIAGIYEHDAACYRIVRHNAKSRGEMLLASPTRTPGSAAGDSEKGNQ
ncbi:MAG: hypothetical protein CTY39_10985 [Hyphomicrobium sp.]|nr:MAG: hypothetical protein CTY39_10985 [Hyphomicrobium sp.]